MEKRLISDYYAMDRKIEKKTGRSRVIEEKKLIKVGILGASTLSGVKESLNVKCHEAGLVLKSYVGRYNQYNQELLDVKSGIYRFNPHLLILFLDTKDLFGEDYYFPYRLSLNQRKSFIRDRHKEIINLARLFTKNCSGKILVNNLSVPTHSTMGILENKQEYGFFEMVRDLNRLVEKSFRNNPQVYIFDYDSFLSRCGKMECCDNKMCYVADIKLNQNYIPALCDEYMRYIKAIKGRTRKCIVLDLDNTLWGGVVGEDGFEGIKLGPTPPGNAFVEFQKYLLGLYERGVMLAINSSNNRDEAMKVIKDHPSMALKEDCFASIKINWDNKSKNMAEIAKEMNIGLDSLIYIDDDKRNRQLVGEMLPQVMVLDMPDDPALYLNAIKECADVDILQLTEEDKKRNLMYAQERKRRETKLLFDNVDDFLAHLEIKVTISKADNFDMPRISQLTQKTNQFNMTTRRYQEEDIKNLIRKHGYLVYSIRVKDKFGDNGLCGVVMLKKAKDGLLLDNFLLSCRVLGKGIERSVMAFCARLARKAKVKSLICEYSPTEKNQVARQFLEDSRLRLLRKTGGSEFWTFGAKKEFKNPRFVKVIVK